MAALFKSFIYVLSFVVMFSVPLAVSLATILEKELSR
jgi:hypothetical protein